MNTDWSIPENGSIDVPDELMPLFNKVGFQFRFVRFSGKDEVIAIAHIVQAAQKFFSENPHLLNREQVVQGSDTTEAQSMDEPLLPNKKS